MQTHTTGSLSAASRRALRGGATRAGVLAGFALAGAVLRDAPFEAVCDSVSRIFAMAAVAAMMAALWRRVRPVQSDLNLWDESIAFNGIAILGHLVQHLHA